MARDKLLTKVRVTEKEQERIKQNSDACSMTVSAFIRVVALGYEPKSTLDCDSVLTLAKVNADQGRLAGLLKMWLTNEERHDAVTYAAVKKLLFEIEEAQGELCRIVENL